MTGVLLVFPSKLTAEVPEVRVRELKTPWGTVFERVSYYLEVGKEVQHGVEEMFSDDGVLSLRFRYAHGEAEGLQQSFYRGTGKKQTETNYLAGIEHGISQSWDPDGKLLFEGTWKNGNEWEGWFAQSESSSGGSYHRRGQTWEIAQWKDGKEIPDSLREVEVEWRDWEPGQLPDPELYCRWRWSQFATAKNYPYLVTLPPFEEIPFLIEYCAEKETHFQVAWDQMMTLTRVDFGNPWLQNDDERAAAAKNWREWWKDVGQHRPMQKKTRGVRDIAAWNVIRGERDLPLPKEPVVIPETYELTAHFRSGDYFGVTSETLTIRRTENGAELVRKFSKILDGPVTEEHWLPFSQEDADRVVRAIGYLVDQPWWGNNEKEIERRSLEAEKKNPKSATTGTYVDEVQKGRESYGQLYYPDAGYELRDGDGKLWWNADVDDWNGGNPERFNHSQQAAPGVVFPFLARIYPESERREDGKEQGWAHE